MKFFFPTFVIVLHLTLECAHTVPRLFVLIKNFNMFNFEKKTSVESTLRKKIASSFDTSVRDAIKDLGSNDPLLGGLMVEVAIGNLYQALKNSNEMEALCSINGLDYQSILEDECNKALQKYLEQ